MQAIFFLLLLLLPLYFGFSIIVSTSISRMFFSSSLVSYSFHFFSLILKNEIGIFMYDNLAFSEFALKISNFEMHLVESRKGKEGGRVT